MSLASFIERQEVATKIKLFRPKLSRKIGAPIKKPRTEHYRVIGHAFDYLLRFELHRRAPHAKARAWAVESVSDIFYNRYSRADGSWSEGTLLDDKRLMLLDQGQYGYPLEIAKDASERGTSNCRTSAAGSDRARDEHIA